MTQDLAQTLVDHMPGRPEIGDLVSRAMRKFGDEYEKILGEQAKVGVMGSAAHLHAWPRLVRLLLDRDPAARSVAEELRRGIA